MDEITFDSMLPSSIGSEVVADIQLFRNSKLFKKSWSPEEDAKLVRLVEIHGAINWSIICDNMGGNRTGKQCRERYHNHLHPDIKKGEWTEEEDRMIAEMHAKVGNAWAKMTKMLPGRTDNSIKNRWHTAHRHQVRINSAMYPTSHLDQTLLPSKTKPSKMLIPKLSLPANQPMAAKMAGGFCTEEIQHISYDHSLHAHEMTLSSRSDLSLPDAPSSCRLLEAMEQTAVSATKCSPRLEIISSEQTTPDPMVQLLGGSSKPFNSFSSDIGSSTIGKAHPSLSFLSLSEVDTGSTEVVLDEKESGQSLLELNLDFLYTSSPSSCFDERDDEDFADESDSSFHTFGDSQLLEVDDDCFYAMDNMAISSRTTPRSPFYAINKKQRI